MENTVYTKIYEAPPINKKEVLRYAGVKEATPEIEAVLRECLDEIETKMAYRVCWREFPISFCDGVVDLAFVKSGSVKLAENLKNCSRILVFAATVGIEVDRLIARYGAMSPTKALFFQAIGAERIESLCDIFCLEQREEKKKIGKGTRARFSPGYGDFAIDMQRDIFKVLDPSKRIGLTLNESMLMSPSKSVTAIIGISDDVSCEGGERNCKTCNNVDCEYRRDTGEDN